jgi:hypothetical protein
VYSARKEWKAWQAMNRNLNKEPHIRVLLADINGDRIEEIC